MNSLNSYEDKLKTIKLLWVFARVKVIDYSWEAMREKFYAL